MDSDSNETASSVATPRVLRPSLGADTSVTGKLSFEAPTRIDGRLKGEVRASDLLVIGESGRVEGIVRAKRLIVHGQVHGEIRGAEHVEVAAQAVITGMIEAHSLTIHDGATLRADLKIEPPRPATVHVLHPGA
jgi:cytoskeletal protein CcmA (bactofilin family)